MTRSILTRALHSLLAVAVIYQLASSLVMEGPKHGHEAPGLPGLLFESHEWMGLGATAVVLLFWIWSLVRRGETRLGELFPWFSRERIQALKKDLVRHWGAMRHGSLPPYEPHSPLAAAIHGLGLALIGAMALTGTVHFIFHGAAGQAGTAARAAIEVHTTLSNLVWAYLIGHAGIALLHQFFGHDIIQPMFRLRQRAGHAGSKTEPQGNPSRSAL